MARLLAVKQPFINLVVEMILKWTLYSGFT